MSVAPWGGSTGTAELRGREHGFLLATVLITSCGKMSSVLEVLLWDLRQVEPQQAVDCAG